MKNIAVFVSGSGSNLQALLDAEGIDGRIVLVVSSKPGVYALERAQSRGIDTRVAARRDYPDAASHEQALLALLAEYRIDLVVLAGYLSILGKGLVSAYRNRIINIHPSLIPSFCGEGFYGLKVHAAVLEYGAKVSGATVHFVDEGADTGAIILQKAVEVREGDTPETLQARILEFEHQLLPEAVRLFCAGRLKVAGRHVTILNGREGERV